MNLSGAGSPDLLVQSRAALLDALLALDDHLGAVTVIGAQAIYLRTAAAPVALAEATKDSDLAVDPRELAPEPRLEEAMSRTGFVRNPNNQPGAWVTPAGIPVDLMVPEALAGAGGRQTRGARIPPHAKNAARRARGLEAAVVDNSVMEVTALDEADTRLCRVKVAGAAALLVAKLHKLGERANAPGRLVDKDAHDIYRILIDTETEDLALTYRLLLTDPLSAGDTKQAVRYLDDLFATGPTALGASMAGRAEAGIGEPVTVAVQTSVLAADLVKALRPAQQPSGNVR